MVWNLQLSRFCHWPLIFGGVQSFQINSLHLFSLPQPLNPFNPRPQERNLKKVGEEPTVPVASDLGILSGSLEDATQAGDNLCDVDHWKDVFIHCNIVDADWNVLYVSVCICIHVCIYIYT